MIKTTKELNVATIWAKPQKIKMSGNYKDPTTSEFCSILSKIKTLTFNESHMLSECKLHCSFLKILIQHLTVLEPLWNYLSSSSQNGSKRSRWTNCIAEATIQKILTLLPYEAIFQTWDTKWQHTSLSVSPKKRKKSAQSTFKQATTCWTESRRHKLKLWSCFSLQSLKMYWYSTRKMQESCR